MEAARVEAAMVMVAVVQVREEMARAAAAAVAAVKGLEAVKGVVVAVKGALVATAPDTPNCWQGTRMSMSVHMHSDTSRPSPCSKRLLARWCTSHTSPRYRAIGSRPHN